MDKDGLLDYTWLNKTCGGQSYTFYLTQLVGVFDFREYYLNWPDINLQDMPLNEFDYRHNFKVVTYDD